MMCPRVWEGRAHPPHQPGRANGLLASRRYGGVWPDHWTLNILLTLKSCLGICCSQTSKSNSGAPGQPTLHSETLSQTNKTKTVQKQRHIFFLPLCTEAHNSQVSGKGSDTSLPLPQIYLLQQSPKVITGLLWKSGHFWHPHPNQLAAGKSLWQRLFFQRFLYRYQGSKQACQPLAVLS